MALWGDPKLFICILFIACCCTVALAEVPSDCCLRIANKQIHKKVVADYQHQVAGQGCAINATIFVTRSGRRLCVPPNQPWVHDLMSHVDHLKKVCKKINYKGNRCIGVKHE